MTSISSISKSVSTSIGTMEVRPAEYGFIKKLKELSFNPSQALEKLQQQVLSGKTFAPTELLSYQIMAQRFGLTIEVATKIADGISTSVRKLQSQ